MSPKMKKGTFGLQNRTEQNRIDLFTKPTGKIPLFVFVPQLLSHVRLFVTPWTAACQAPLSFTISWSLLKFMSIKSVMLSHHLILCHPLSSCSQSFPASRSFPMSWLFHWVAKVLELQQQSFQWIFMVDFL